MLSTRFAVKRLLLGGPLPSRRLTQQLLPKRIAMPVFGAHPIASVVYGSQELLVALALIGAGALALASPLALGVVALLALVTLSYRELLRTYPHGGGAYMVAKQHLGEPAGLVAAASLLVGDALVAAVSVAAASAALVAAFPPLAGGQVWLALLLLAVVAVASLRGLREGSLLLTVPTYAFLAAVGVLLVTGLVRCGIGVGGCPTAPSAGTALPAAEGLVVLLVLRAFASGAVVVGGVEAFSNGVTALRYPQSHHAARALGLASLFAAVGLVGLVVLARATGVVPQPGMEHLVLGEVARALLGEGVGLVLVQVATSLVLLAAAAASFADFPRLASVLARDRWLARQLLARGDRVVFANGILLLALGAGVLVAASGGSITRLVPLYVLAVFTALTLCLAGLARRSSWLRGPGWRRALARHALGAAACGVVAVGTLVTAFLAGAWAVVLAVALLALLMRRVRRHYHEVGLQLRRGVITPGQPRPHHAVILLDRVDEAAARALSYALTTGATSIRALGVPLPDSDLEARWAALAPDVPLEIVSAARDPEASDRVVEALRAQTEREPATFTNALLPETLSRSWFEQLRDHRLTLRVQEKLQRVDGVVVSDVTSPVGGPGPYTVEEPAAHHVVVLVSAVDAATVRALSYAHGLQATDVRALGVNLDPERSTALLAQWDDWGLETPVEVLDSPFRSLTSTVRSYVRDFAPDGRHTVVTCVLPTFVLAHPVQGALHNQSAMVLRSMFLFERGVVATSVPYPLGASVAAPSADAEAPAS